MAIWLQNLLVFLLVAACGAAVVYQLVQGFRGKKSRIGQCCAKGCAAHEQAAQQKPPENRIVFMPVEMLARKRR